MSWPTDRNHTLLAAGAAASVALYCGYHYDVLGKMRQAVFGKDWVEIGKLKSVWIYPVKSLKGQNIDGAMCTSYGVQNGQTRDRQFVILNGKGEFVTIRAEPSLCLVECRVENGTLSLSGPDMDSYAVKLDDVIRQNRRVPLELWGGVPIEGLDCGAGVAEWITKYLKKDSSDMHKIVYHIPGVSDNMRTLGSFPKATDIMKSRTDMVMFPDSTPYHVIMTSSLENLNQRLPSESPKVDCRSFRPNFELETAIPYDEDKWAEVKIGDVTFSVVRPCDRCILTQVNPDNAHRREDKEPLNTLRKYRLVPQSERKIYGYSPLFGCNFAVNKEGKVNIGDTVSVIYKK